MRAPILAMALLLAPQAASAETWRMAAYSNTTPGQQLAYFVDVDSVQRNGSKVTFNSQTVYEDVSDTRDFDRSVIKREADCSNLQTRMLDSDFYVSGVFLDNETGIGDMLTAKAGTVLETMLNTVCGRTDYLSPPVAAPEAWARDKFRNGFSS